MQPIRTRLIAASLAAVLAAPVAAQEATPPAADAPAAETPAPAAPTEPAPTEPAAQADQAPAEGTAPAEGAAEAPAETPAEGAAPAEGTAEAPAGEAPKQGEVMEVIRDTFGDWQVRCAPEGDECFMYQLAMDDEKNPVAEVSILKLPEEAEADAGVTVVTPLGTLLPQGVVVQIDAGEQRQYPFAWCSQVGCFARFGLARASIDAMKRGNAGKLTLHAVAAPERPVTLALSLTGFTAAYDSLAVPTAEAAPAPTAPAPAPEQSAPLAPRAPLAPATPGQN
jgi:invasion protein IalB